MPGIARVGVDRAGGTQLRGGNTRVFANGALVQVLGGIVKPHGRNRHLYARMVQASKKVFAQGIPVCKVGDKASCGHATTGSPNVFVDDRDAVQFVQPADAVADVQESRASLVEVVAR